LGQLLDQRRDAGRELTGEAVQRTATENTALKQGVRQLTAGNRSLAELLEAARSSNQIPAGASPHLGSQLAGQAFTAGRAGSELSGLTALTPGQRRD
jgi:hypothetical protein